MHAGNLLMILHQQFVSLTKSHKKRLLFELFRKIYNKTLILRPFVCQRRLIRFGGVMQIATVARDVLVYELTDYVTDCTTFEPFYIFYDVRRSSDWIEAFFLLRNFVDSAAQPINATCGHRGRERDQELLAVT